MPKLMYTQDRRRKRVRGDGPDRKELPIWHEYSFDVPDDLIRSIKDNIDDMENDLRENSYPISNECDLPEIFRYDLNGYRQNLLQMPIGDYLDEHSYTQWRDTPVTKPLRSFLAKHFGAVWRTRISMTPPGGFLDWHIDSNTSVFTRHQIAIDVDENMTFGFRYRDNGEHIEKHLTMKSGKTYFINTGWSHSVSNNSNNRRIVVIFESKFDYCPAELKTLRGRFPF